MRSKFGIFAFLAVTALLMLVAPLVAPMHAQATEWSPPPIASWFQQIDVVYGAVIVIGGYLTHVIPGLKLISSGVYRVLAFAILVGAGFFLYGADIWSLALTYFFSTSMYEVFLKGFLKSPRPRT